MDVYLKVCFSENKLIKVQEARCTKDIKKLVLDLNTSNYYLKAIYRGKDEDAVSIEFGLSGITVKGDYLLGKSGSFKSFMLSFFNEKSKQYQMIEDYFLIIESQSMSHEYQFLIKNKVVHSHMDMSEISKDDIEDIKRALCKKNIDLIQQEKFMKEIKVIEVNSGKRIA